MARILDGTLLANSICQEVAAECYGESPTLAVILCGNDPASEIYVNKKREACKKYGINSQLIRLFDNGIENWSDPQGLLLDTIRGLNHNESVHGILLQLPLPVRLDRFTAFDVIDPMKDVDVFSPCNVGLLVQGRPRYLPCTPQAVHQMLQRSEISTFKKKVVVINRSDVVGKPLSAMLSQDDIYANATVCMCHDHTPPDKLKELCLWADIIVVAVGKPKFLTADMVSAGAVVIDVGINRIDGKVVGDVDFLPVSEKASAISKVPGGIGPLTIACLLRNTLEAFKLQTK